MNWSDKIKAFLHDPPDKCLDIATHIERARKYALKIGVVEVERTKGSDIIASCMERSLLPKEKIIQDLTEIWHPLCEENLKIEKKDCIDELFKEIERVYEELGEDLLSMDDKRKFFYIWRNLQDRIFEKLGHTSWAKYISTFPADTRVPDHSIWEHLKIASAINAHVENNQIIQNNSLFLFTIGPVQSFISQARKTQDFYLGSYILSYLTFKAMEIVIDLIGPTNIVYPDLYKQPLMDWWIKKELNFMPIFYNEDLILLPTIPNRFVAILPTSKKTEIESLVNKMKLSIRETLQQAKEKIFEYLNINIQGNLKQKIESQISEFPEIYWVAVPWKIDGRDITPEDLEEFFDQNILERYKELIGFVEKYGEYKPNIGLIYGLLYTTLEKSMGSRKNVRKFLQSDVVEQGRKCSVCGERDVIFFWEEKNKNKFIQPKTHEKDQVVDLTEKISIKYLADGEGLCALCFLKRTFDIYLSESVSEKFENLSFPSTAEVACSDFKEKALNEAENEYFEYQDELKKIIKSRNKSSEMLLTSPLPKLKTRFGNRDNVEGAFFYEENLREKYFEEQFKISLSPKEIEKLKKVRKKITDKVGEPNPYYALVYLDGDDMGKWLSGELLPEVKYAYNSNTWEKLEKIEIFVDENGQQKKISFAEGIIKVCPRKFLTPAIHASISTALRNYALEFVRKIVEEEHLGKLIYAGGDDVLAFVNLRDLFDIMEKLRWSFSGRVKVEKGEIKVDLLHSSGFVEKDGKYILTMGRRATASMGVVIAHYKTPLQIVIRKVLDMGKLSKTINDKNSFAICLMKRSGEERIAKSKWICEDISTIDILKEITKAFDHNNFIDDKLKGYISKSFIQKLALNFAHLKNENGDFLATPEVFNRELIRLVKRSLILVNEGSNKSNNKKRSVKEWIKKLTECMQALFYDNGGNIDNFINLCMIVSFIHKAEE